MREAGPRRTVTNDIEWMAEGECKKMPPELFFPIDGSGVDEAIKVCGTCAVKSECLEYALKNRIDHGIWGGASENERRRMSKERAKNR